jgi:(2S)-methylsuccinyl-CoA dehydrogenase
VRIGMGEYLDQMFGGIPMSQTEIVRPRPSASRPATVARFDEGRRAS